MLDEKLLQILVGVINAELFEAVRNEQDKIGGMQLHGMQNQSENSNLVEPVDIEVFEPKNIQHADRASGRTFWLVYGVIYFTDYVNK